MAIRKIEMKPPGIGDYADTLYPKTSADIVEATGSTTVQAEIDALKSGKSATNHNHTLASLSEKAYTSLTGRPTLGTVASLNTGTTSGTIPVLNASGKIDIGLIPSITKSMISDFPTLGTVASLNTGIGSGDVPILGSDGKLNDSVIPKIAITDTFPVSTQAAMLALTAEVGDVAVRTDLPATFILRQSPASVLANWTQLAIPTDLVTSVAGKTGAVTLVKGDVGLANVTNESKATMFSSPMFTGTPTAPTASTATNTTQIATTAFVKTQGYITGITKAMIEAQLTGAITSHTHTGLAPALHADLHISGGADTIPNFTSAKSGLTPSSGGGTTKYLRADGTWVVPPNTTYTKLSQFTNDVGFITASVTIGTTQPSDGTMWYKEI